MKIALRAASIAALLASPLAAQTTPTPSPHDHHVAVDARGDHVMGFDHEKTTHHFLLTKSGGVIQVSANDPKDTASHDAIQQHMGHIAKMFTEGDFDAPMLIHAQVPPGVPEMKANLKAITWKPVNTKTGANIVITSKDPAMIKAIHQFLVFQIQDHRTGDPTTVQN